MTNKDFYDGKWHVAIPFDKKDDPNFESLKKMAGVNLKAVKSVVIEHWHMKALMVEVESEEQYRKLMNPLKAKLRRRTRHKRCLIPEGKGGMRRCPGGRDCGTCTYKYMGYTRPEQLSQLIDDTGFDALADESTDPVHLFEQNSFIDELTEFVHTLNGEEQIIARAILTERPDKAVMAELGIEKQSTYSSRKIKVKKKLQKRFADWL